MRKLLPILSFAALTILLCPLALAQTFTIIEDLPNSFFAPVVFLSDDGLTMSGSGFNGVFYWTETDGVVWIDDGTVSPQGGACSGDGMTLAVTFQNPEGLYAAGYWNPTDLYQFMDPIPEGAPCGSDFSTAYALNYDGTVGVGLAWIGCDARAFKWTMGVGAVNLGSSGNSSRATGISSNGTVVVGFDEHPSAGYRRPAIWTDDIVGPQLIAGEDAAGECQAVSSDGSMVCGQIDQGALYWDAVNGAVALGTLPGDEPYGAYALDISDLGEVIGFSGNPFFSTPRGFIWTVADGMMPISDYFTAQGVTGWEDYGIYSATAISADGQIIAGAYSDPDAFPPYGVYIVRLSGGVSVDGGDDIADPDAAPSVSVRLDGAYPNPFNPQTNVKFSLARAQNVRLAVFDMTGRLVNELADRQFTAGDHSVRWSGTNALGQSVPSGTYLLRLESADGVRSDKMMLVR
jgi:hypothetical protein